MITKTLGEVCIVVGSVVKLIPQAVSSFTHSIGPVLSRLMYVAYRPGNLGIWTLGRSLLSGPLREGAPGSKTVGLYSSWCFRGMGWGLVQPLAVWR